MDFDLKQPIYNLVIHSDQAIDDENATESAVNYSVFLPEYVPKGPHIKFYQVQLVSYAIPRRGNTGNPAQTDCLNEKYYELSVFFGGSYGFNTIQGGTPRAYTCLLKNDAYGVRGVVTEDMPDGTKAGAIETSIMPVYTFNQLNEVLKIEVFGYGEDLDTRRLASTIAGANTHPSSTMFCFMIQPVFRDS